METIMNFVELKHPTENDCHQTGEPKVRYSIKGKDPLILSDIYQEDIKKNQWHTFSVINIFGNISF